MENFEGILSDEVANTSDNIMCASEKIIVPVPLPFDVGKAARV